MGARRGLELKADGALVDDVDIDMLGPGFPELDGYLVGKHAQGVFSRWPRFEFAARRGTGPSCHRTMRLPRS